MRKYRAVILLSAHGNSPFIKLQVESILKQLTSDDLLVIADDGSKMVPWERIPIPKNSNFVYFSRLKNLGTKKSFLDMLFEFKQYGYYYFFSDQDDIWYEKKIIEQINKMTLNEICWSFHSVDVIDSDGKYLYTLEPISPLSKIHYFFETPQPGMTFCLNYKCIDVILEFKELFSEKNLLHDQIISSILLLFKEPTIIKESYAAYRIHGNNQTGLKSKHWLDRMKNISFKEISQFIKDSNERFSFFESMKQKNSIGINFLTTRIRTRIFDEIIFKLAFLHYKINTIFS